MPVMGVAEGSPVWCRAAGPSPSGSTIPFRTVPIMAEVDTRCFWTGPPGVRVVQANLMPVQNGAVHDTHRFVSILLVTEQDECEAPRVPKIVADQVYVTDRTETAEFSFQVNLCCEGAKTKDPDSSVPMLWKKVWGRRPCDPDASLTPQGLGAERPAPWPRLRAPPSRTGRPRQLDAALAAAAPAGRRRAWARVAHLSLGAGRPSLVAPLPVPASLEGRARTGSRPLPRRDFPDDGGEDHPAGADAAATEAADGRRGPRVRSCWGGAARHRWLKETCFLGCRN